MLCADSTSNVKSLQGLRSQALLLAGTQCGVQVSTANRYCLCLLQSVSKYTKAQLWCSLASLLYSSMVTTVLRTSLESWGRHCLHVVIATWICFVFGSNWAVCFITGGRQNILSLMIAKKYAEYQLAVIFKHQCQRTEKCYCFANMKTRKHFQCSNHSLIKQEKWLITDRKLMTICMILHKSTICQRNLTPVLTEVTIFWLKATAEV